MYKNNNKIKTNCFTDVKKIKYNISMLCVLDLVYTGRILCTEMKFTSFVFSRFLSCLQSWHLVFVVSFQPASYSFSAIKLTILVVAGLEKTYDPPSIVYSFTELVKK